MIKVFKANNLCHVPIYAAKKASGSKKIKEFNKKVS